MKALWVEPLEPRASRGRKQLRFQMLDKDALHGPVRAHEIGTNTYQPLRCGILWMVAL